MKKVQWNKRRSRDGACFHPPEQARRPEHRGQGCLCRGPMVFFLPWRWPTFLLAAVLRIPLKGSSWGFWWLTGNWYTDNPIHFRTLKSYFSFYELVPQLYNCVLEIKRPSTECRENLKKYLYKKKKRSKYRCFLGFRVIQNIMWERPHMATRTGAHIFFWW